MEKNVDKKVKSVQWLGIVLKSTGSQINDTISKIVTAPFEPYFSDHDIFIRAEVNCPLKSPRRRTHGHMGAGISECTSSNYVHEGYFQGWRVCMTFSL